MDSFQQEIHLLDVFQKETLVNLCFTLKTLSQLTLQLLMQLLGR